MALRSNLAAPASTAHRTSRMMPRSLSFALALLSAMAIMPCVQAQEPRYEAWTVDGNRVTGTKLTGNHEPAGAPQLDGKTILTDDGGSTRALWDRSLSGELTGPYVQFTNGDLLPGRIVSLRAAGVSREHVPGQVMVLAEGARDGDLPASLITVRESALAGVGLAKSDTTMSPGQVLLADGRIYTATAIRCEPEGLHCLTADGVQFISFDQLRGANFPRRDPMGDLLQQNAFAGHGNRATIVRMRLAGGGVLTLARGMAKRVSTTRIMVRPPWALESFPLYRDRIAWHTWWRYNEMPLSLLPVEWQRASQGLHAWPARLNANVMGGNLRCQEAGAEVGLGTHSGTRGTFTLPPSSQKFSAWVGIDRAAGSGGCAIVKVYRDEVKGDPLWQSGFLRGGEAPVRIGPLDLGGAKQLVLVTDWAHEGRPAGADPLDIRDYVDWIHPFVELDASKLPKTAAVLDNYVPELAGWQLPEKFWPRVELKPVWAQEKWKVSFAIDPAGADANIEPVELTRRERITLNNARFIAGFGHDASQPHHHKLIVLAEGQEIVSTLDSPPTSGTRPGLQGEFDEREYSLTPHLGKEVTLTLRIERVERRAEPAAGILWRPLELRPLIDNLPKTLEPLHPSAPLTSLDLAASQPMLKRKAGETNAGEPLTIRGYRLTSGFGVPAQASMTYKLTPSCHRFVAVVGLAKGNREVGPFTILIDGQPHWKLDRMFGRNSPGVQIDVPIPAGHETITFLVGGSECEAAWGNAGFLE